MIITFFDTVSSRLTSSKHRKLIHFILITLLVLLQLIVLLLWYNESINEEKLATLGEEIRFATSSDSLVDEANSNFMKAQESLQAYLQFREASQLEDYFSQLDAMTKQLDTLSFSTGANQKLKQQVEQQKKMKSAVKQLKTNLDSLFQKQNFDVVVLTGQQLQLKKLNYKDILDSVEVETHLEADSLARKSLFSRLMDAFSGRIEIKKEILNQKVTMKYGKMEESGTIEEQLKNVFENADRYYQQQFRAIQEQHYALQKQDQQLLLSNDAIVQQSKAILDQFKNHFVTLGSTSVKGFEEQQDTNQTVRFYSIFGIVLIMLVLSAFLFFFTRLAFANEHKLIQARETIQQNLSFKNKIVGMLSHEIRSPLSLISIYSKKVSQQIDDFETKDVFKTIQFTTNSLLIMVNQVLDFSKNETTRLVLNKKSFDLAAELDQIILNLHTLVNNSGNELIIRSTLQTSCFVFSDATKIHQLLYNIVGNANKFTDQGIIQLGIDSTKINARQYQLDFAVQDNGRGISEADLAIIFEGFYNGVNSIKINDLGAGLGLHLCKEIVELFGGTISVESKLKHGTTVLFTIYVDCVS